MLDPLLAAVDVYLFYGIAALIIHWIFYFLFGNYWRSWLFAVLIVFVSSEFWEIPIFFMAYAGAPGFGTPHIFNHGIVFLMAVLLLAFFPISMNNRKRNLEITGALFFVLFFNGVFLLVFPGLVSSWILRSLSLIVLSWIWLREGLKHE